MSNVVTVLEGDTFESIARRVYGIASKSTLISNANPGVVLPLVAGVELTAPDDPAAPKNLVNVGATSDKDLVTIRIDGEIFTFWESVSFSRSIDGIHQVVFTAPFESSDSNFQRIFKPFSYKIVEMFVGGVLEFTGRMIVPAPSLEANRKSLTLMCYSLPGVLVDCQIPSSVYPVEYIGINLTEIATSICESFGLGCRFRVRQWGSFLSLAFPVVQVGRRWSLWHPWRARGSL